MRNRILLLCASLPLVGVATACITLAAPTRAQPGQLIGVVGEPRSASLRITTINKEARDIGRDAKTHYTKWLTHQPWTIDTLVNEKSLTVGRCVKITLREDDFRVAKRIEISLDGAGTLQDVCKNIR